MPVQIKRVAYTYNEALEQEGKPAYFFDCYISSDKEMLVNRHESFMTRDEFYAAIADIVPLLEDPHETREDTFENV